MSHDPARVDPEDCMRCMVYAILRAPVLDPALAERRAETGETMQQITDRYMTGVHRRHLAGLPLTTTATT